MFSPDMFPFQQVVYGYSSERYNLYPSHPLSSLLPQVSIFSCYTCNYIKSSKIELLGSLANFN